MGQSMKLLIIFAHMAANLGKQLYALGKKPVLKGRPVSLLPKVNGGWII
jgi:hypothetical protein